MLLKRQHSGKQLLRTYLVYTRHRCGTAGSQRQVAPVGAIRTTGRGHNNGGAIKNAVAALLQLITRGPLPRGAGVGAPVPHRHPRGVGWGGGDGSTTSGNSGLHCSARPGLPAKRVKLMCSARPAKWRVGAAGGLGACGTPLPHARLCMWEPGRGRARGSQRELPAAKS